MKEILIHASLGLPIVDSDLEEAMQDTCINNNHECSYSCPVFAINGGSVPADSSGMCKTFCDGKAMLNFIRQNVEGYVPTKGKAKKRVVATKEDIERFARFKNTLKQHFVKTLSHDGEIRIFTCKNPLKPQQFTKIVYDYGINEVIANKIGFLNVIVAIQRWPKPIVDANLTIRDWLNRELGVKSFDELVIPRPIKTIHVDSLEELNEEAQKLKQKRGEQ